MHLYIYTYIYIYIPVSVKKHSFYASIGLAILQQKLLPGPRFCMFEVDIPMCILMQRSVFVHRHRYEGRAQLWGAPRSTWAVQQVVCGRPSRPSYDSRPPCP